MLNLGYVDGKRKRKSLYGKTRREVQEKLAIALRDRAVGLPVTDGRTTLGRFLDRWLDQSAKPNVRPSTYRSYEMHVRVHLKPALGRFPLAKLDPVAVQDLINRKLASGLSPRSVQFMHAVLRRALTQAVRWGLVSRNVAKLVDVPPVRRKPVDPLSAEQARSFLKAIRGHRLESLFALAIGTGLRQGELLALRWSDVCTNPGEGAVRVRHSLHRKKGGGWLLVDPKSKQSNRVLPMPESVAALLRGHRAAQAQDRLRAGSEWHDHDFVFTTRLGTPLDGGNVTARFQELLAEHKLPRQRFHDLRHCFASLLLAQGEHPRTIMESLGHSQIALTMNTYSHVMPVAQRDAAYRLDQILTDRNDR